MPGGHSLAVQLQQERLSSLIYLLCEINDSVCDYLWGLNRAPVQNVTWYFEQGTGTKCNMVLCS